MPNNRLSRVQFLLLITCIGLFGVSTVRLTEASLRIFTPNRDVPVLGDEAIVEIQGCKSGAQIASVATTLNGASQTLEWRALPYSQTWTATLSLKSVRGLNHTLEIQSRCPQLRTSTIQFQSAPLTKNTILMQAEKVATEFKSKHFPSRLGWDWGEGVFLYALSLLPGNSHQDYLKFYHRSWAKRLPKMNRSDSLPPTLSALELNLAGDSVGKRHLDRAIRYIEKSPRNALGTLNHLGHAPTAVFYPASIWLDSLMMYGVLAAKWAKFNDRPDLLTFALEQPRRFAEVLQDSETGLFRHAWWLKEERAMPREAAFWLRGNGWVVAAVVDLLELTPTNHAEFAPLVRILQTTLEGLKTYQLAHGGWDSIINIPGFTYFETSGTALVAYAALKGARLGWLDPSYREFGLSAYQAVTTRLKKGRKGYSLGGISGPTNALPKWTYRTVKTAADYSYGIGAYLLAAGELARTLD